MFRITIFYILAIIAVYSFAFGANPLQKALNNGETTGDCPLFTTYTWQGNGGLVIAPLAIDGLNNPAGSLTVQSIPAGSNIVYAYFASTGWHDLFQSSSGWFHGVQLCPIPPAFFDQNENYYLSFYRWEVTSLITGNGTYNFSCQNLYQSYLVYLVIIYQNPASPNIQIALSDGAESLMLSSSTSHFYGLANGNGTLSLLTQAGGDFEGDEAIIFNGNYLAGPGDVFRSNIGNHADFHSFNLNNIQSENSLVVTTGEDWIGIHLAVLTGSPGAIPPLNVTITPINPPIQIPATGGSFNYSIAIQNSALFGIHYQSWIKAIIPGVNQPKMLNLNYECYIPANSTINYDNLTQNVRSTFPAGNYLYIANTGWYPNVIYSTDTLTFEKLAGRFDSEGKDISILNPELFFFCAYPNPFNSSVVLRFEMRDASPVDLIIYDITGREVWRLASGISHLGTNQVVWDAENLPSGIYLAKLMVDNRWSMVQKLLLIR